ncbi:hydroxymethylglutaryl-CoA synthase family protein [Chryseobacterium sp. c4a]|uniref:hydroxymethylglutaryl-CoA synthase family protein n=1 Tax=Chryseobacterium sp. c4a TaxID=1573582 RepID=UPI00135B1261|nr:hydroxymethylglutaryl-CoA synthase family protein [Chryseobacterium sp. c4a]
MINVGIESMNVYAGSAFLDVNKLALHRQLDTKRFVNLMMKEKAVAMPFEDPISFGVNAAKPIVDKLSEEEKQKIELLITCTESGIDFGKSVSTYIHKYLNLSKNCRMMEVKQACYSGTIGFQMAVNFILSNTSPGAKALVIASDISRFMIVPGISLEEQDWSFAEPSGGAGAVAMLVSDSPHVFQLDQGASGYYGYEIMDTCRPVTDGEAGDVDMSLLAYLDCCENAFLEYQKRVIGASYRDSFQYLTFHTPFGGMVKGAHRTMMRKMLKAAPSDIENDFNERVVPGLSYCQRVGNIMGATVFLSLLSTIEKGAFERAKRIGCFSYGSGCCSEFYSGVVTSAGQKHVQQYNIERQLDQRYELSMSEYDELLKGSDTIKFGTRDIQLNLDRVPEIISTDQSERLILTNITNFHRNYKWIT